MRLTVGPLPPAVYWRRRAIVLAVFLSIVAFVVSRCGSESGAAGRTGRSQVGPTPTTSSSPLTPIVDPARASTVPSATATVSAQPQPTGACTDDEVVVTVSTEGGKTTFVTGESVKISLKIKNVSARSCGRDIGGAQQELRVSQGAQKFWSSDDCAGAGASDTRTLAPNQDLPIGEVAWNGRTSTSCQNPALVQPGTYQLIGRVGTASSQPVTLTVKGK